jgi:hypothetical protein
MSSKDKVDSMGSEIERALMPGGFVRYDDMYRFVEDLERVREQLVSAKSKYYDAALRHFDSARKLYLNAGCGAEWQAVATLVQTGHWRKRGFLSDFLSIQTNEHQPSRSAFVRKAEERWRKQTS